MDPIVKKVRLSVILSLITLILMGCIPSKADGFSIYLLADEIPATELREPFVIQILPQECQIE